MSYLICKKCGGYYKLEEGESLDDFDSCECGGELELIKKKKIQEENLTPIISSNSDHGHFCPKCGTKTKKESEFCKKCGTTLTKTPSEKVKSTCPQCNTKNPSEALYCSECGSKIEGSTKTSSKNVGPKDWIIFNSSLLNYKNILIAFFLIIINTIISIYTPIYSSDLSFYPFLFTTIFGGFITYLIGNENNGYIKNSAIAAISVIPFAVVYIWYDQVGLIYNLTTIIFVLITMAISFVFGGLPATYLKKKHGDPKSINRTLAQNNYFKKKRNYTFILGALFCAVIVTGLVTSYPVLWMSNQGDFSGLYKYASGKNDGSIDQQVLALRALGNFNYKTSSQQVLATATMASLIENSPSPRVRETAAFWIANIMPDNKSIQQSVVSTLSSALINDKSKSVRIAAASSLGLILLNENQFDREIINTLKNTANTDDSQEVREKATEGIQFN